MSSDFLFAVTKSFWHRIQHQSLADLEADLLKMEANGEASHHLRIVCCYNLFQGTLSNFLKLDCFYDVYNVLSFKSNNIFSNDNLKAC